MSGIANVLGEVGPCLRSPTWASEGRVVCARIVRSQVRTPARALTPTIPLIRHPWRILSDHSDRIPLPP